MQVYCQKTSDIVKNKLKACGGKIEIPQLRSGCYCSVELHDEDCFVSNKLPHQVINFSIFDIIVDFLKEHGGSATKGAGRGPEDKVGHGKCTKDTVLYVIATEYYGLSDGDSTFDPLFVIAAILQWAGIARNTLGELVLY